jgi:tRNA dimethylallyltransferase
MQYKDDCIVTPGNLFHRAIYLTGQTASGKTVVGVALAQRLDAEIVALDSMTLYRGMDIGTAKPTLSERRGIPHHLIDVLDPWQSSSVAEYREWAAAAIDTIEERGKRVLFVGGTALFMKALLRGLFEGPPADLSVRVRLEQEAGLHGVAGLHARLRRYDPPTADRVHPNDLRRIVRALEVIELTGQPLSRLQVEHETPAPPEALVFALNRQRPDLHQRIHRRVTAMFEEGLVEEVRFLQQAARPISPVAAQGVGYREVIELLEGKAGLAETIERVGARTRQFAKRQATWFRGLSEVTQWTVASDDDPEQIADQLAARVESARSGSRFL